MQTNRRNLIKQIGLTIVGLGIAPIKDFAFPIHILNDELGNNPIRLSSNENPYGPSPLALSAMTSCIKMSNRYSWDITKDLISAISKKNNVAYENIMIGAGSTELINIIIEFLAFQKGSFIVPNPSYTNWTNTAEKIGLRKISVPLTNDKHIDLKAMLSAIEPETKMIYICNPNNPTATICEYKALVSFIKEAAKKVTVLVDEAYLDFTKESSLCNLAIENKNLIVLKTFSKIYGLAGARIGYAVANAETIKQISQMQSWANGGVSVVSRAGAIASLKDDDFVNQCYSKNEESRKYTIEQMERLNISCIPSNTNFIYFSLSKYKKDFFELLKTNSIQGTNIYEEDGRWSRITVGTLQEMQKFISVIG